MNLKKVITNILKPSNDEITDKKYVVLSVSSYPMEVSKEQFNEIKNSVDNIVELETDDTIYLRIVK